MPTANLPWLWGHNGFCTTSCYGDFGNGSATSSNTPVSVSAWGTAIAVAANNYFSVVLRADSTVWTSGGNGSGDLGNGTYNQTTTPTEVLGPGGVGHLTGIVAIAAGNGRVLAIHGGDGTLWAWGGNGHGELGIGSTADALVPTQVLGVGGVGYLTNIVAVSSGYEHTLAADKDGHVYAWGWNFYSQLGDNSQAESHVPVQVLGPGGSGLLGDIVQVAAGDFHSLARDKTGAVWAWGYGSQGQLGTGSTTYGQPYPAPVLTTVGTCCLSGASSIGAGGDSSVFATAGGVYTTGSDSDGVLGDNDTPSSTDIPVPVLGPGGLGYLAGVVGVSEVGDDILAVGSNGIVYAWGLGSSGQLGNNGTASSGIPVQVQGAGGSGLLTGMSLVATGGDHSMAAPAGPPQGLDAVTPYKQVTYQGDSNDPVDTYTGDWTYQHTDLAIPGRGPSPVFTRSYSNRDPRTGPLGPGWTDNDAAHVAVTDDGAGDVILVEPNGRSDLYRPTGGGTFAPPPSVYTNLVQHADGSYTATQPDQTTWAFNALGELTAITDRSGNTSPLTYNGVGQLTNVGDPASRGSLTFGYDPTSGLLTSVTDWASPARVVQYGYDSQGRLHTVTDRAGNVTTYGYDGTSSRIATITDANSHTAITLTYDSQGRVQTQQDAMGPVTGQKTTFGYVTNQDGTQTTNVTYPATSFDGYLPTEVDTYNTSAQLVSRVATPANPSGGGGSYTTTYAYDANFDLASVTDARGNTTAYCYDTGYDGQPTTPAYGNLTRTIAPPPASGQNPLVSLSKYDTATGQGTASVVDNLVETVSPKGVGNGASVTCSTDLSAGVNTAYATDYAYDGAKVSLLSVTQRFTDPDKGLQTATTAYQYTDPNNPGAVTAIVPPLTSHTASYTYYGPGTEAGMLQKVQDALGDATSYAYDPVGRRLTMTDPMNGLWSYSYDNEDRLTETDTPPVNGAPLKTQYTYDPVGNRTIVVDASGQVTKYLYDARDSLAEVDQSPQSWTVPNSPPTTVYRTTYTYDNNGNLSRIDRATGDAANERATDYQYDGLNRLRTEIQYPAWPTTTPTLTASYAYDGDNNRTSIVDAQTPAQTTTYGYDADNRLSSITYSDGVTHQATYSYDANGNRLSMGDGTGATSYLYDELNRLTSVTQGDGQVIGYRYDTDGNRSEVIYPGSHVVANAYDNADRLQTGANPVYRTNRGSQLLVLRTCVASNSAGGT